MRQPLFLAGLLALAACGIQDIGKPPDMTTIGAATDDAKPILDAERAAIAVPPPQPARFAYQQGSLWNTVEHKTHVEYQTLIPDLVLESEYLAG